METMMNQKLLTTEVLDLPGGKLIAGLIETEAGLAPAICLACGSCGGKGCSACGGLGYTRLASSENPEVRRLLGLYAAQVTIASAVVDAVKIDIDLAVFPAAFRSDVAARLARAVSERLNFKQGDAMCGLLAQRAFINEPELARSKVEMEAKNGV